MKKARMASDCATYGGDFTCFIPGATSWNLFPKRTAFLCCLKFVSMLHEPIQCLIVEDEEDAVTLLRRFIGQTPQLELVDVCRDTGAADPILQARRVDLVFLDINLPGKSGIEWKRGLPEKIQVIFTTADSSFGAEGFNLDAVDYLLKPFSYDRFLRSIERFRRISASSNLDASSTLKQEGRPFLMVRAERMLQKIFLDEVLYIEAKRNHLLFYLDEGILKVYQPIRAIEARLPPSFFLRIHRSFIVATGRVRAFSSAYVQVANVRLPVGRSYQASAQQILSRHG
ncbi:MAG: response regulator transcription factor [Chitinophagaceae bacterium]|nr:MAG: response regulator transcription factor [Chitinophagaceae bacterium]